MQAISRITRRTRSPYLCQCRAHSLHRPGFSTSCATVHFDCLSPRRACSITLGLPRLGRPIGSRWYATAKPSHDLQRALPRTWREEQAYVKVGGSGSIRLDVYTRHTTVESGPDEGIALERSGQSSERSLEDVLQHRSVALSDIKNGDIVLYLPSGPFSLSAHADLDKEFTDLLGDLDSTQAQQPTTRASALVVIRVNYRLDTVANGHDEEQDVRYPAAIHDVAKALDWVLMHRHDLCPSEPHKRIIDNAREVEADDESVIEPSVSICGSHFGGALALTLALTAPNEIHAVAVRDPVVDWVGLDELVQESVGRLHSDAAEHTSTSTTTTEGVITKRKPRMTNKSRMGLQQQAKAAKALIDVRTSLFRTASGIFDPFASPILFLRAPGRDTPYWPTARPEAEIPAIEDTPYLDSYHRSNDYGPYDDDMHTIDHAHDGVGQHIASQGDMNTVAEAIGSDAIRPSDSSMRSSSTNPNLTARSTDQTPEIDQISAGLANLSILPSHQPGLPQVVKRRKVLRRWPAVGQPEDVLLPYIRIFSDEPSFQSLTDEDEVDFAHVLHPQAKEMSELLRRACFWGHEKSFAEERVTFEVVNRAAMHSENAGKETARWKCFMSEWLVQKMNEE